MLLITSCDKFEYSPYQEKNRTEPRDLNAKNIARLLEGEQAADDTITIVFYGDSQRFYDNLEELVTEVNSIPNVDFFIIAGDISDFGLLHEFEWIDQKMERLNVPFMCCIGNHDLTANGLAIFRNMFGPENVSFRYKGYKFIFHDTNGREHGFTRQVPDLSWLGRELADPEAQWFVGVSHVPPYDSDFDRPLEAGYTRLFANTPGCRLSLHGHIHETSDCFYYNDSVRYIGSNAVEKDEAILLKLYKGKVFKQMLNY